jgi:hypothetical protein
MSPRMQTFLASLGILCVSGVACHLLAKDSAELDRAAARVGLVPGVVGDWKAQDEPVEEQAFEQTGAKSYWMRTYVNQKTQEGILVILMCGRPGKMSVHTPEVCYRGAGFEIREEPSACAIKSDKAKDVLWTSQFAKKGLMPTQLRLYWAWNSRGDWQASPSPRWQFRGEPFLYKLYVSREFGAEPRVASHADPAAEFLRQFLPVLKETLFADAAS